VSEAVEALTLVLLEVLELLELLELVGGTVRFVVKYPGALVPPKLILRVTRFVGSEIRLSVTFDPAPRFFSNSALTLAANSAFFLAVTASAYEVLYRSFVVMVRPRPPPSRAFPRGNRPV
jgi:hypothetical protein